MYITKIASVQNFAVYIFFLSEFSFTDTDDSRDGRRREGTTFISLYHFHPHANNPTFICNFASEMTP